MTTATKSSISSEIREERQQKKGYVNQYGWQNTIVDSEELENEEQYV